MTENHRLGGKPIPITAEGMDEFMAAVASGLGIKTWMSGNMESMTCQSRDDQDLKNKVEVFFFKQVLLILPADGHVLRKIFN